MPNSLSDTDSGAAAAGSRGESTPTSPSVAERAASPSVLRMTPSPLGVLLGALGYALATGPSLLPRTLTTMVVVGAIGAVLGYALGAVLGAGLRLVVRRPPRWLNAALWVGAGVAWVAAALVTPARIEQQVQQARLIGASEPRMSWVAVLLGSLAVAVALVLFGRAIRALARGTATKASGWGAPRPVALAAGIAATAVVLVAVVAGAYAGIRAFYTRANATVGSQAPPESPLRSGSPGSLVAWDSLGEYGRQFVTGGPTPEQMAAVSGSAPQQPIRVYVGLDAAATPEQRANLAVQELRRTGAFERDTLVVAVPTGTGLIDPDAVDSAELITGGDVATVGVQYSVLPSWLSFLVDQPAAERSGRATVDAVTAAWRELPAGQRPRLVVFGESLGAFGGQGAFPATDEPGDVVRQVDGAVWSGPPAQSALWSWWRLERTAGPAWAPVIQSGRVARVGIAANDFPVAYDGWGPRRISFAAHPNDPVVYWSPALAFSRPNWLVGERAPSVPQQMRWWPLVTFWQCAVDLGAAGSQPPGAGHNYSAEIGPQWASVLRPPGWTPAREAALQRVLAGSGG